MAQSQGQVTSIRQRTKMACEPCRSRKRRCNGDGHNPCESCQQWEYECYYAPALRKRKRSNAPDTQQIAQDTQPLREDKVASPLSTFPPARKARPDQSMEASSGVAFPHLLGARFNPSVAPKISGFGWNTGLRPGPTHKLDNVCSIITEDECIKFADIYFEVVHPLFGFINKARFYEGVPRRWREPQTVTAGIDSILCGVAALGCLFSTEKYHSKETDLIQCARSLLEQTMDDWQPNLRYASGWLLRTLYLRATATPHAVWMASCTLMHLLEAAGGHQEPGQVSIMFQDTTESPVVGDLLRRLFWLATMLNSWIANEYGRTRVVIEGVSCRLPSPVKGDLTSSLLDLYQLSVKLDPSCETESADLEAKLRGVEDLHFDHDALTLSQSNLALAIYRRLRVAASGISDEALSRVIRLGNLGLDAAERLAHKRSPWWHVLNVPFQVVCILLAMDCCESFSCISRAMDVLKLVNTQFGTSATQKALETAKLLVKLTRQCKEQDIKYLDRASTPEGPTNHIPVTASESSGNNDNSTLLSNDFNFTAADFDRFDWNLFLETSVPISVNSYPQACAGR